MHQFSIKFHGVSFIEVNPNKAHGGNLPQASICDAIL